MGHLFDLTLLPCIHEGRQYVLVQGSPEAPDSLVRSRVRICVLVPGSAFNKMIQARMACRGELV